MAAWVNRRVRRTRTTSRDAYKLKAPTMISPQHMTSAIGTLRHFAALQWRVRSWGQTSRHRRNGMTANLTHCRSPGGRVVLKRRRAQCAGRQARGEGGSSLLVFSPKSRMSDLPWALLQPSQITYPGAVTSSIKTLPAVPNAHPCVLGEPGAIVRSHVWRKTPHRRSGRPPRPRRGPRRQRGPAARPPACGARPALSH